MRAAQAEQNWRYRDLVIAGYFRVFWAGLCPACSGASARLQLGERYKFGGKSPATGFDCSGLTWFSHKENGIHIPRQSFEQFNYGRPILKKDLKAGDLVFFETYRQGASHVGIYKGAGEFIHAPNRNKQVQIQVLSNSYYRKRYLGARRYW